MKKSRMIQDYLLDILDAMDKAAMFTDGLDLEGFCKDDKTAYAVIRSLEIIGGAAKKVPADMRRRFPDIPWPSLAGMRDKLIHDYVGVSLEVVWRTVQEDIPSVRPRLVAMLEVVSAEENRLPY